MRHTTHQDLVENELRPCLTKLGYRTVTVYDGTETGVYFNDFAVWILLPPISYAYLYINRLKSIVGDIKNKELYNVSIIAPLGELEREFNLIKDKDMIHWVTVYSERELDRLQGM